MLENKPREPNVPAQDLHAPVDPADIRLNFNCLIYLFTEQMAMFNELTKLLKEQAIFDDADIRTIYSVTGDKEVLSLVYQAVFQRFIEYYASLKQEVQGEEAALRGAPSAEHINLEDIESTVGPNEPEGPTPASD